MVIEMPIGKGRRVKAAQSSKLSNELGIIAQNFLTLPNKWKELTKEEKYDALIRCHNCMNDLKALYILGESSLTIDKNVYVVLCKKSEYIKGLGYGPKLDTTRATPRRATELEDSLKKVKEEAATIQHDLQKRLDAAEVVKQYDDEDEEGNENKGLK
ncbi:hypothetical protein FXO38_12608 [Capsicum annuum]|nr:hypothetical protein FXO38_12608 [Capsicum annuum]